MQTNDINIVVHVGMGACGLIVGLVPLLSFKGGKLHRRSGRIFAVFAGVVLLTALLADVFLKQPIALLAASLSATYQYCGSLRALYLRSRGPGVLDAAMAGIALAACATLLHAMNGGTASWSPMIGYSTAGFVSAIAVYDLSRSFWSRSWLRYARPLDHGLKMTGCYFAMLSAGAGNLLKHFQPWSQILPSSIGMCVMVVLTIAYVRRRSLSPAVDIGVV
jgi:uncharacterized membrane protein